MNKNIIVNIRLECPDGLEESLGYELPKEIDSFLNFINKFNNLEGYKFKAYSPSV